MMGVVYRDLKPENVLVRGDGHIMLSDFDLSLKCDVVPRLLRHNSLPRHTAADPAPKPSSCVAPIQPVLTCFFNGVHKCQKPAGGNNGSKAESPSSSLDPEDDDDDSSSNNNNNNNNPAELVVEPVSARSRSFVGTHEYLAPEVISGQGHGGAVDWWTLGVFMYEMIYGRTPFKGETNAQTLANIVKQPLSFPRAAVASGREWDELLRAQDLMTRLLAKNPRRRLGGCTGSAEVKRHGFFKGVNWALVRSVRPPHVPKKVTPPPLPQKKKRVVVMSRKERQEPFKPRNDDNRFDYF
ncbi:hypothetical protein PR202_ga23308 [Eleusine coracana subsp. coracana]|uniref:non-specific serine/threonine protein kinase n=1 Tax=Eleusine coracana subsp. coracana TaxID=191504 RepID=A0AAV5D5X8_ELECO|nr:hypothetical protein PR202_ga23308 [Eleusine coracana subsp. coracana]